MMRPRHHFIVLCFPIVSSHCLPPNPAMSSTLFQLSKLIADSVAIINTSCSARGVEIPDLNSPFSPQSEAFRFDPAVVEAVNVATAAAYQLAAVLEPPPISMAHSVGGVRLSVIQPCNAAANLILEQLLALQGG